SAFARSAGTCRSTSCRLRRAERARDAMESRGASLAAISTAAARSHVGEDADPPVDVARELGRVAFAAVAKGGIAKEELCCRRRLGERVAREKAACEVLERLARLAHLAAFGERVEQGLDAAERPTRSRVGGVARAALLRSAAQPLNRQEHHQSEAGHAEHDL